MLKHCAAALTLNYQGSTNPVVKMPPTPETLGKLQHAIMRVLWDQGEGTVADVHRALESRGLAPTTIATMLRKMEAKGVVLHRTEGRRFIYRATVTEDAVKRSMVADLTERLFGGDAAAFANHLIEAHDVDADELDALRKAIDKSDEEQGT
ncbi:MAG: BlaI/MecI/CopY family transcriptional regulator [Myxococcota bacterium]